MVAATENDLQVVDGQAPITDDVNEIREHLQELKGRFTRTYFEFGEVLQRAYELGAHKTWGFPTWKEYVEEELGMSERRCQYLLSIHKWFNKVLKDHPHVRQRVEHLGWSKVRLLVGVVDETNVDEWVARAEKMTLAALQEFIKELKAGKTPSDETEKLTTLSIKLYPEQVANVEDALELAKEIAESDKRGHLIDLICTTFKADHVFSSSPGTKMSELYIAKIEKIMGVRLVVVDEASRKVKYGLDVLERLAEEPKE